MPKTKQELLAELLKSREEMIARHVPEGMTEDDLLKGIITAASKGELGDVTKQLDEMWDTPTKH